IGDRSDRSGQEAGEKGRGSRGGKGLVAGRDLVGGYRAPAPAPPAAATHRAVGSQEGVHGGADGGSGRSRSFLHMLAFRPEQHARVLRQKRRRERRARLLQGRGRGVGQAQRRVSGRENRSGPDPDPNPSPARERGRPYRYKVAAAYEEGGARRTPFSLLEKGVWIKGPRPGTCGALRAAEAATDLPVTTAAAVTTKVMAAPGPLWRGPPGSAFVSAEATAKAEHRSEYSRPTVCKRVANRLHYVHRVQDKAEYLLRDAVDLLHHGLPIPELPPRHPPPVAQAEKLSDLSDDESFEEDPDEGWPTGDDSCPELEEEPQGGSQTAVGQKVGAPGEGGDRGLKGDEGSRLES
ncbi:unnamed protein product, partial [Discosporangium mesarthrocarpum]